MKGIRLFVLGIWHLFCWPLWFVDCVGISTQFDHPKFKEALKHIRQAAHAHGKFAMIFAMDTALAQSYLEDGFDGLAYSMDLTLIIEAAKQMTQTLKRDK